MTLETREDVQEYIHKKQNYICIVCEFDEMYDEQKDKWYCPRCNP
jgi:ribosomal protein L37AE/L43A